MNPSAPFLSQTTKTSSNATCMKNSSSATEKNNPPCSVTRQYTLGMMAAQLPQVASSIYMKNGCAGIPGKSFIIQFCAPQHMPNISRLTAARNIDIVPISRVRRRGSASS